LATKRYMQANCNLPPRYHSPNIPNHLWLYLAVLWPLAAGRG